MIISIIVATTKKGVIGKTNQIPWYMPEDLKRFKEITMGHHIIMGRKTHESIGKALPGRTNLVITNNPEYVANNCQVVSGIEKALELAQNSNESEAFIIGGASIYKEALPLANKLYLTLIKEDYDGDVFFPEIDKNIWKIISTEEHPEFTFQVLERVQS